MRRSVLSIVVTATFLCSAPLVAQVQSQFLAHPRAPLGPMVTQLNLPTGLHSDTSPLLTGAPIRQYLHPVFTSRGGRRQGTVLMIVGGAGILAGLLLDEDIITIAGAGVAGVGLYFYLR